MIAVAIRLLREQFPGESYPPRISLMVGDRPEDEKCAQAAGLNFQRAAGWRAEA
jgi:D-glycero-D-manno-heptose 1,7-bisphosphate phosphatase